MVQSESQPGQILAGRYRLVTRLGQGAMGTVWRAEHVSLGSPVAVKLIGPDIPWSEDAMARFRREAKAAAALRSPHVVQIFDYGVDNGVPYIAMELLEGDSLASRLDQVGRLPLDQTARIMSQVARAMSRAHEAGIVHRDLKPDNIHLARIDGDEVVKVLDFGIAKTTGPGLLESGIAATSTGAVIGTPFYMSPEQAQGTRTIDWRSDIWSIGVIVYECVLGQRPFESPALGDLVLKICMHPIPVPSKHGDPPKGFDEWFARACAREPADRFQSAKDACDALLRLAGLEIPASVQFAGSPDAAGVSRVPVSAATSDNAPTHVAYSRPAQGASVDSPRSVLARWIAAAVAAAVLGAASLTWFMLGSRDAKPSPSTLSGVAALPDPGVGSALPSAAPSAPAAAASALASETPPPAESVARKLPGGKTLQPAPTGKNGPVKPPSTSTPPAATTPGRNYGF